MPHSLRVKIKNLRYKGIITDKDCDRLCKALDNENVLDKIIVEIESLSNANPSYWHSGDMVDREEVLEIIDKYKAESEDKNDL